MRSRNSVMTLPPNEDRRVGTLTESVRPEAFYEDLEDISAVATAGESHLGSDELTEGRSLNYCEAVLFFSGNAPSRWKETT